MATQSKDVTTVSVMIADKPVFGLLREGGDSFAFAIDYDGMHLGNQNNSMMQGCFGYADTLAEAKDKFRKSCLKAL